MSIAPTPIDVARMEGYTAASEMTDAVLRHAAQQKAEIERLRAALAKLYDWYDRDGSVGGASVVFEDLRGAYEQSGEQR